MVRVRFAPSPTGRLHLGNARTAILNYLFARKENGVFILRIEDTDRLRSQNLYREAIIDDLLWLGIKWDEGPYLQSERIELYKAYAEKLLSQGFAYKCFCSKERLLELKEDLIKSKEPPRYDGKCRDLSEHQRRKLELLGKPYVIRFMAPKKEVKFTDMIFGEIQFPSTYVDDFIIIKADGTPSYNFACAIDDLLMDITHVIRGRDHIANTPKQILIFDALRKKHPIYAHHPLLLEEEGRPLSKREGSKEIDSLKKEGIIPEAIINYLGVLGRNVKKEVMSFEELIESFSFDSISKSDQIFDFNKLLWFNKKHIRMLSAKEIGLRSGLFLEDERIFDAIKENVETLAEIKSMISIFKEPSISEDGLKYLKEHPHASAIAEILDESLNDKNNLSLSFLRTKMEERGISLRKENMMALRILITGKKEGPPIDTLISLIPHDVIKGRIECFRGS